MMDAIADEREHAKKRIRTWNDPALDAEDEGVVDAFVTLSQHFQRIYLKPVKDLINSKRTKVGHGTKHKHIFYTVPHINFPGGD